MIRSNESNTMQSDIFKTDGIALDWEALTGFDFWGYKIHPAADAFPYIDDAKLEKIALSIHQSGLRLPIIVSLDGQLIDGRNRARALCLLGIDDAAALARGWIELRRYDSDAEILAEVAALNLDRRTLTTGQEALAAARLVALGLETDGGRVRDAVAESASVSARTIQDAKAVLERGCAQLVALVESDTLPVYRAALIARRVGADRQAHLLKETDDPGKEAAWLSSHLKVLGTLEPGTVIFSKRWDNNPRSYGWGTVVKVGRETGKLQAIAWPGGQDPDEEPQLRTCWPDEVTQVAKDVESERIGARVRISLPSPGLPPEGSEGEIVRALVAGRYLVRMDEAHFKGALEIRDWLLAMSTFEVVARATLPAEEEEESPGRTVYLAVTLTAINGGRLNAGAALEVLGEGGGRLTVRTRQGRELMVWPDQISEEPIKAPPIPFDEGDEVEFARTKKGYPPAGTTATVLRITNLPPGMVRVGTRVAIDGSYRPTVPASYLRKKEAEPFQLEATPTSSDNARVGTRDDAPEDNSPPEVVQATEATTATPAESDADCEDRAKEDALATGALVLETVEQVLRDAHKGLNRALKGQVNQGAWFSVEQELGRLKGYTAQALYRLDVRGTGYPPDAALKVMRRVLARELERVDAALNRHDHRDQLDIEEVDG